MPYNQTHKNSNDGTRNVNTDGANGQNKIIRWVLWWFRDQVSEMRKLEKVVEGLEREEMVRIGLRKQHEHIGIAWPEGSTTTLGIDGLDGMGGGGGAVYADNMSNNSSSPNPMYGGSGGNGIVVLRFPRNQFDLVLVRQILAEDHLRSK